MMPKTTHQQKRAFLRAVLNLFMVLGLSGFFPALTGSAAIRSVANALLDNPGFEGNYSDIAPGWEDNSWGEGWQVTYSRETSRVHGGNSAQRIEVSRLGTGAVQLRNNFTVAGGSDYQGSIWLRSDTAMQVKVLLRYRDEPYLTLGSRTITTGPAWTEVSVQGGDPITVPGSLFVQPLETGTLYADDAAVGEVSLPFGVDEPFVVPDTLFGLTMNHQTNYAPAYPTDSGAKLQTVRLHDTGLRWNEVETAQDSYQWQEFDRQVNDAYSRGINVMYTLGLTPRWASARPNELGAYGASNLGASAEPADFNDWLDYVDAVSGRYAGRIQVYEVWNEVDFNGMFSGSIADLVELSRLARNAIKANDPQAILLAPNFTQFGVSDMDDFIAGGGDQYVDGYAFHLYSAVNIAAQGEMNMPTPESHIHTANRFQSVLKSYAINKPIWITEGAVIGEAGNPPTADERDGALARAFLIPLASGYRNFAWYTWEGIVENNVKMFDSTSLALLEPGIAFATLSNWLSGATVLDWTVDSNNIYRLDISNAEGVSQILWKPDIARNNFGYSVVDGTASRVFQLDGSDAALAGNQVEIGPKPVRVLLGECGESFTLPDNQWRQISLPCDAGGSASPVAAFGDDLLGEYGSSWSMWFYDTAVDRYVDVGAAGSLQQGVGYWIIQTSGGSRSLDLPVQSAATAVIQHSACTAVDCVELALGTQAGTVQWNMVGYPFTESASLNAVRAVASTGNCRTGCTLDDAALAGIVNNELWTYNGTDEYIAVNASAVMEPWTGYWIPALQNAAQAAPLALLVPAP
jgi:hypothetical protein